MTDMPSNLMASLVARAVVQYGNPLISVANVCIFQLQFWGNELFSGSSVKIKSQRGLRARLKSHAGCNAFMDGLGKLTNRDRA